jgi:hypothetical protein
VGRFSHAQTAAAGVLAALALLPLAGCTQEREPLPAGCLAPPAALQAALRQAPPALIDGATRVSRCVSAARTDGDLQSLGILFVRVADTLRPQAASDPDAAYALGYLGGAVARGAEASSDRLAAQLARRVAQVTALDEGAHGRCVAALARGRRDGERAG